MGCWTVMGGPCVQRAPQECCLPGPAPRGHRCHSAHTWMRGSGRITKPLMASVSPSVKQ